MRLLRKYGDNSPQTREQYQKVTLFYAFDLFNDGKHTDAHSYVNKSLSENYSKDLTALAYFLKGDMLYKDELYTQAQNFYTKFLQIPLSAQYQMDWTNPAIAQYNLAYCHLKNKSYGNAVTNFSQVITKLGNSNSNRAIKEDAYTRNADSYFMLKNYSFCSFKLQYRNKQ